MNRSCLISTSNSGGCPEDQATWMRGPRRGESVTHGPCDCFLYDRMAKRPAVLENLIFELIGVLEVESGLEPSKRGLARDFPFNVQG
jgi:hypothetical protein